MIFYFLFQVQANEHLIGDVTLTLQRGPHTARLQWRTFGESVREWTTFQTMLDGYASSRTLLAMVAHNSKPVVSFLFQNCCFFL